jgi:hypothetical protein
MSFLQRFWNFFPSSHYALLAIFFLVGLEVIFAWHSFVPLLIATVLFILFIGIVLVRAEEGGRFHPTQTILPTLSALGLTGFALFLPTTQLLHVYFIGCALVFFYVLKYGAKQAYPTWNWIISLLVLFLSLASLLGWRFHLYIPILLVVAGVFVIFFLISLQSLQRLVPSLSETLLLSLAAAFVLSELTWVLQFLPLYYLVQTGVLTATYYVLFHLVAATFEGGVKRRDVVEYIVIGAVALFMILVTARWV